MKTIFVDELKNLGGWSNAIQSVGFNKKAGECYVVWKSNPTRVYRFNGATKSHFDQMADIKVMSVRRNVQDICANLWRQAPVEDATLELFKDDPKENVSTGSTNGYKVVLKANGTFEVTVDAKDFNEAVSTVQSVFEGNLVDGTLEVTEVKKV